MSLYLVSQPSDAEIADAQADVRADIVTAYSRAKSLGHRAGVAKALLLAMNYDAANPDEPPVMDEIHTRYDAAA
ncbi:hypothetical protein [Streptomyces sp. PA03-2a]|uniref:hypothetical protein n=1 Tax=Streptomyces sp. PA03-2a TaxID=3028701 RepID=UPI0029A9312B|nr:hypothetical protein [Streptomyces sp. PA03-2a]MDX2732857.1 hypothetical protein [Streptomyces sp. PA03-2a]